jgi:shikimate kinase
MSISEPSRIQQNIVLVGFMGSGKSTIARVLHQRLGYPLVEMDQVLEERAGKAISRIFEEEGEGVFRGMESAFLRELDDSAAPSRIISTGGGVVGSAENRELLRKLGYVVWLKVPAETVLERTARTRHRPLLNTEDPEEQVRALMRKREPLYEEVAHLTLETSGLSSNEVATGILECARYHFTHSP